MNRRVALLSVLLTSGALIAAVLPALAVARQPDPLLEAEAAIERGHAALRAVQAPDGGWQRPGDPPAITAIVLRAFVHGGKYDTSNDFIKKGYDQLLSYQLENGGIYKDLLANYNTAIAVSALAAADEPSFKPRIEKAVAYLKGLQWTENTGGAGPKGERVTDEKNPWYGGWGYGRHGRPDGSNMQLALDALHDAGLKPQDPAYQAALKFVSRMQNQSETNDQPWAGDDGGFVYTPANNGESFAGETTTPDGERRLRSYGSMTYAGLKSMIYAGLTKDDPRVKAAWNWITRNWTLDENPGMRLADPGQAQHGLYYYYHTLARALNAYDQPSITDPSGKQHDWRVELIEKLTSLQQPDGTWVGDKRWMEDNPVLVTSYAVLALQEAVEDLKQHPPAAQEVPKSKVQTPNKLQ
ncbi:MAG TPA: prenyltransferase/squalene oxidase repeat-containing protein [Tepidisphaeraceae bacterium]|nr:prenyltransferase/squalene oxidase repeat-containing protein [Tepidisphaeraceae bacterium]